MNTSATPTSKASRYAQYLHMSVADHNHHHVPGPDSHIYRSFTLRMGNRLHMAVLMPRIWNLTLSNGLL